MCFVPNWIGHRKSEFGRVQVHSDQGRLSGSLSLPGMESQSEMSGRVVEMGDTGWYKVSGLVTNRDVDAEELVWWYRQRCGKGEEVHSVLKEDLAGGRLPSGLRSERCVVGNHGVDVQPELSAEAVGAGR